MCESREGQKAEPHAINGTKQPDIDSANAQLAEDEKEVAPIEAAAEEPEADGADEAAAEEPEADGADEAAAEEPEDDGADEAAAEEPDEVWVAADGTPTDREDGDDGEVIEPEAVDVEALEAEFLQAQELIRELAARLRMVSKAYQEQKDDMAAFRKRVEDQGKVKESRASFDAVKAFFDPVQNLKRSLAAPGTEVQPLVDGLGLIVAQFIEALEKLGLEETPGEGSDFNPEYHEALAVMPVTDVALDGKVVMVHATGYTVTGKVLRASQVVIGKFTPEEVAEA